MYIYCKYSIQSCQVYVLHVFFNSDIHKIYIFYYLIFLFLLFKYLSSCNGKIPGVRSMSRASALLYQQRTSLPVFGFATFSSTHVAVFWAEREVEPNSAGEKRTRGQDVISDANVARRRWRQFFLPFSE